MRLDKNTLEMNTDREPTPPKSRGQRNKRKTAKEMKRSDVLETK